MFCESCANPLPEDNEARYCEICGSPILEDSMTIDKSPSEILHSSTMPSPPVFTRQSAPSFQKKSIAPKTIIFGIGMSVLFAGGFIIAFLTPSALIFHNFVASDYLILLIGCALVGSGAIFTGVSRAFLR